MSTLSIPSALASIKNFFNQPIIPNMRNNAFDFLRLFFSLLVAVFHSFWFVYPKSGEPYIKINDASAGYLNVSTNALNGFFIIGGFLVTASFVNSQSVESFLKKRFLRIYPAFWTCLVVTGLFFCFLFFTIRTGESYNSFLLQHFRGILYYVEGNLTGFMKYNEINDMVSKNILNTTNSSLWTIIIEIRAYIFLTIFGILGFTKNKYLMLIPAIICSVFYVLTAFNEEIKTLTIWWFGSHRTVILYSFFFSASCFYLFLDKIVWKWKWFLFHSALILASFYFNFFPVVATISFTYFVLFLVFAIPFKNISKKIGDPSYGIYLYSWPISQVFSMLDFARFGIVVFATTVSISSIIAGLLSWHLVEKHFLKRNPTPNKNLIGEELTSVSN